MRSFLRILSGFLLAMVVLGGAAWLRVYLPVHYEPPAAWGAELDSHGHTIRSIDLQRSYHLTGWMPDPEGGHVTKAVTNHYYLNQPGKPRQELTFLPTLDGKAGSYDVMADKLN